MRTNNLQLRMQLRSTIQSTLDSIMQNNNISATDMEEAIEHYLNSLKEQVMYEYVNWSMQERNALIEEMTSEVEEDNTSTSEEDNEEE